MSSGTLSGGAQDRLGVSRGWLGWYGPRRPPGFPAFAGTTESGGFGLFVADYVYYELLGGGDPVVGLEAVGPVLHDVVEELDDGDAVGGLGSDEPGHEEFVYPREDSEEVSRKGGRGVQGHGHQAPLLGGAGVGRVGASIDGVAAWDAFVLGEERRRRPLTRTLRAAWRRRSCGRARHLRSCPS